MTDNSTEIDVMRILLECNIPQFAANIIEGRHVLSVAILFACRIDIECRMYCHNKSFQRTILMDTPFYDCKRVT